ncbi:RanBP1 domain protein, partial [Opisthorchis viverrini]
MSDLDNSFDSSNSECYFQPVVSLPPIAISNTEENEEGVFKRKAKLYRYDRAEDPPEWKERGKGVIQILKHNKTGRYRVLMRRDRTFKVCANHVITSTMQLRPNCNSDRAFVWQTLADFADEVPKPEFLGVRFSCASDTQEFKKVFEDGVKQAVEAKSKSSSETVESNRTKETSGDDNEEAESQLSQSFTRLRMDKSDAPKADADEVSPKLLTAGSGDKPSG